MYKILHAMSEGKKRGYVGECIYPLRPMVRYFIS